MMSMSPTYKEAMRLVTEGYSPFPMHISRKLSDGKTYLCSCGKCGTLGTPSEKNICKGKHPLVAFSEWKNTESFGARWESYGIGIHTGKSYCWVLDVDGDAGFAELKQLTDKHGELPETRCVKTGGGGRHYYFAAWVDKVCSGFLTDNIHIKGNVGNAYVVVPPTLHHSGNKYEYINRRSPVDAPDWLLKMAQDCTPSSTSDFDLKNIEARALIEVPITKLLTKDHLKYLHTEGRTIRGHHPIHGSTTGRNFTIDIKTNRWFCTRHHSNGGLFEFAAILAGICDCEDFTKNQSEITIPPLQGKKFTKAVQYCLDAGIDPEDLKVHISRGKYERNK